MASSRTPGRRINNSHDQRLLHAIKVKGIQKSLQSEPAYLLSDAHHPQAVISTQMIQL